MELVIQVQILDQAVYAFHFALILLGKCPPPSYGELVRQTEFFSLGKATNLREGKF